MTIAKNSKGNYKEKGSKFLAFAYPVENEDQVKNYISELKKEFYDARHHCYAYLLQHDGSVFRANDDGEPNHSAGDPILGQIRSRNLTYVLVVVVRYFGGAKLGISGLINAYKTAAADALDNGKIVEKLITKNITLNFPYTEMNHVMHLIKENNLTVVNQTMEMDCQFTLSVRLKLWDDVFKKLSLLKDVQIVKYE